MERVNDMNFSKNQINFMISIGISAKFANALSDTDYEEIEEKVSEHLQKHGFDKNYEPNEHGKMCESILDML